MQWNDETLGGLSTSVRYIKWPSALAYDEINIHVKIGWVIMKSICGNVNECGENMIWG